MTTSRSNTKTRTTTLDAYSINAKTITYNPYTINAYSNSTTYNDAESKTNNIGERDNIDTTSSTYRTSTETTTTTNPNIYITNTNFFSEITSVKGEFANNINNLEDKLDLKLEKIDKKIKTDAVLKTSKIALCFTGAVFFSITIFLFLLIHATFMSTLIDLTIDALYNIQTNSPKELSISSKAVHLIIGYIGAMSILIVYLSIIKNTIIKIYSHSKDFINN